jgi:hypothetical protein
MKIFGRNNLHLLINDLGLKTGIEIGVQMGGYSKYLLENTNMFLYMVDPWVFIPGFKDISNVDNGIQEQRYQITLNTVKPFVGRYKVIRKFSLDAVNDFEDNSLDFIYLDADHSYKAVAQDLLAWYPKLKEGGLFSGHDFVDGDDICGSNFGVRSAVLDFLKTHNHVVDTVTDISDPFPNWWFIKE